MTASRTHSVVSVRYPHLEMERTSKETNDFSITSARRLIRPGGQLQPVSSRENPEQSGIEGHGSGAIGTGASSHSHGFEKNLCRLDSHCYLPEKQKIDLIVLHFTAGLTCESAYRTWQADPRRIATAYGVDPDGTIVEFFPPEAWAYHLGIRGTSIHDRRSIGIEIANAGPLRPDPTVPGQLNWWPGNWRQRYCHFEESSRYVTAEYRGIQYFAAMPLVQMEATARLVRQLCLDFGIPLLAGDDARQGVFNADRFAAYQGVASHSNFRADKWDVGPAFAWSCLD